MVYNFNRPVIDFQKVKTEKGVRHLAVENKVVIAEKEIYEDKGYIAAVVVEERPGKFKILDMFRKISQIGKTGWSKELIEIGDFYAIAVHEDHYVGIP